MKPFAACVYVLLLTQSSAFAAATRFDVKTRVPVIEDERPRRFETRRDSTEFRMEVLSESQGAMTETTKNRKPFVAARNGERYSVRLYNPLPVRVAVNLTVDGLNSISGKPSGIEDGQKWMIEPYSSVLISGWQVNSEEARRFFFTDKPKSYAKWRGDSLGQDLAANCGVIGAAYFWSQEELDRYYEDHPIYRFPRRYLSMKSRSDWSTESIRGAGAAAGAEGSMAKAAPSSAEPQAGTGMGERESHPTTQVDFRYDTGMYRQVDALVVYYDFASERAPNPFPALSYAPEMN